MTTTEFCAFWEIYPRRVSKKDALKAWALLTEDQRFAAVQALPVHVRYWRIAGTTAEFLPYPATWLNGERWEDELEMPEAPETQQWWKTASGIEAKARQAGITPRPGEGHHELKARILAKEKAA